MSSLSVPVFTFVQALGLHPLPPSSPPPRQRWCADAASSTAPVAPVNVENRAAGRDVRWNGLEWIGR